MKIIFNSLSSPDPYQTQLDAQVAILTELVTSLRAGTFSSDAPTDVVLVGHSYGSYISSYAASTISPPVSAVILTGYSGQFQWFGTFIAGWEARVAALLSPERWGNYSHGYLVPVDISANNFLSFKSPFFDRNVAQWLYENTQPFAIGELTSLGKTLFVGVISKIWRST